MTPRRMSRKPAAKKRKVLMNDSFLGRRRIAATVVGPIRWEADNFGSCECPGANRHTKPGKTARVYIDDPANINCFHRSCRREVEQVSKELRKRIGTEELGAGFVYVPTEADQKELEFRANLELVEREAAEELQTILKHQIDVRQLRALSPVQLKGKEEDDWRLLLRVFRPEHRVWIGEKWDSGHEWNVRNFRLVSDWLKCKRAPGHLICPSYFTAGSINRSKTNVESRLFLIVESDDLGLTDQTTLLMHLAGSLSLRAIVHSGRRSLHGWFATPAGWSDAERRIFKARLRGYQCDPTGVEPHQPCRLPGITHPDTGRWQKLCYLDLSP